MTELVRANDHIALNRAFGTREFGELLEKALVREAKHTQKKSFAPSGLGYNGTCPRYWYYAFNGEEFTYDSEPTAIQNMNAGTDSGKRLADLLDKAGILIDSEVEVKHHDPDIFGYIDAIVRWKGEPVVVEVKTTKNNTWNYRVNNNMVPGYQMLQLLIYMYVTKHDKGFFLTENKDTNELFILPVKMNDEYRELVESTFEWMRMVKKNADDGELPTRPFNKSSFECKGCPVKDICWDGYKRGKVNGEDPSPGKVELPILAIPK